MSNYSICRISHSHEILNHTYGFFKHIHGLRRCRYLAQNNQFRGAGQWKRDPTPLNRNSSKRRVDQILVDERRIVDFGDAVNEVPIGTVQFKDKEMVIGQATACGEVGHDPVEGADRLLGVGAVPKAQCQAVEGGWLHAVDRVHKGHGHQLGPDLTKPLRIAGKQRVSIQIAERLIEHAPFVVADAVVEPGALQHGRDVGGPDEGAVGEDAEGQALEVGEAVLDPGQGGDPRDQLKAFEGGGGERAVPGLADDFACPGQVHLVKGDTRRGRGTGGRGAPGGGWRPAPEC